MWDNRRIRFALIVGLAMATSACYNPTFPEGRPCASNDSCPDGLKCALPEQICVLEEADACSERPCEETVADIPVAINRDLDILFVLDNSGSMAEEQASLLLNFSRFVNVLSNIEGGLPNLHIGIVTTDVGAGPFNISGCSGLGDDGNLQSLARGGSCSGPSGAFISDIADNDGTRDTNYTGTLVDTFNCIANLGISGCGFEQPLESMRRALDGTNATNAGFLRASARLAVIILTDEDDCSTDDNDMFDTGQISINDPLGPLSSFRCFEFGVVCGDDSDIRSGGPRNDCAPREGSDYMYSVGEYVDFLKSLKTDPLDVMVAGIVGNPTPVTVSINKMGFPVLDPSCSSASGEAAPAVRLGAFLGSFPGRNTQTTICNSDLSDALVGIAGLLSQVIGNPCIPADIDLDPNTAGVQSVCSVFDDLNGTETEIPRCTANPAPADEIPCWSLQQDADQCADAPNQLTLVVDRGTMSVPTGTHVIVRCLVP